MPKGRPPSAMPVFVEDCRVVSIKDVLEPYGPFVEVTANCRACRSVLELTVVRVIRTPQGPRFRCFPCQRLVMKLFLRPDSDFEDWRCRKCYGLVYERQYKKGKYARLKDFQMMMGERYQESFESYLSDGVREMSAKIDTTVKKLESIRAQTSLTSGDDALSHQR